MTLYEPPKLPVEEPKHYGQDYGSTERARMMSGEPKKNVVDPEIRDPPKPPVVQK